MLLTAAIIMVSWSSGPQKKVEGDPVEQIEWCLSSSSFWELNLTHHFESTKG